MNNFVNDEKKYVIIHASVTYKTGGQYPKVNDIKAIFKDSKYISVSFRERTPVLDISIKFNDKYRLNDIMVQLFDASKNKKAFPFGKLLTKGLCDYIINYRFEKPFHVVSNDKFDIKFSYDKESTINILTPVENIMLSIFKVEERMYNGIIYRRDENLVYSGMIAEIDGEWKLFIKSDEFDNEKKVIKTTYYHEGDDVYDMIEECMNEILLMKYSSIGSGPSFYMRNKKHEEFKVSISEMIQGGLNYFGIEK